MTYPIGMEQEFKGVVDLLSLKSLIWNKEELGAQYNHF
jgi:elongation factor G